MAATAFTRGHIPDITSSEGFPDVEDVETLIELSAAINRTHYTDKTPPEVVQEEKAARMRYRSFQLWFTERFIVEMDRKWVSPFYMFRRSLIDLGSTIYGYLQHTPGHRHVAPNCTDVAFRKVVQRLLQKDYPELVPKFKALVKEPSALLGWSGPHFFIHCRPQVPPNVIAHELVELPSAPIYIEDAPLEDGEPIAQDIIDSPGSTDGGEVDDEDEDEDSDSEENAENEDQEGAPPVEDPGDAASSPGKGAAAPGGSGQAEAGGSGSSNRVGLLVIPPTVREGPSTRPLPRMIQPRRNVSPSRVLRLQVASGKFHT
jgi:hypothetical protein